MTQYGGYLFSLSVRVVSKGQKDTERLLGLPPDLCIQQVIDLACCQLDKEGPQQKRTQLN